MRVERCHRAASAAGRSSSSRAGVCASTRKASHIGAEKNHLWPVMRVARAPGVAAIALGRVVLARTSEPPCFSVMPMPMRHAVSLAPIGRETRRRTAVLRELGAPRGVDRGALAQCRRHRVTLIETGHRTDGLGLRRVKPAARSTWRSLRRATTACRAGHGATAPTQQRVVAGVKLHLVDATAEAVVRMQLGRRRTLAGRAWATVGGARPAPSADSASVACRAELNFRRRSAWSAGRTG